MKLSQLAKIDSNARRLKVILSLLGKYGLADWLKGIRLDWLQELMVTSDGQRIGDLPREVRIRLALTELGTTFIKLGQMLSTRADLVGPELADELKQLQSETPPDLPEVVRETFLSEMGKAPEDLFQEFEAEAMASASIGQVHRARLSSGEPVVVKVQHVGIEETIKSDLEIMAGLAELAQRYSEPLRSFQPVETTAEFRRTLLRELEFTREKRNLEQFARNFAEDDTVHFPVAYPELSTVRILTMELLEGVSVSKRDELVESGADLNEFAQRGANMYLEMIFRDGYYHADPHPGNLLLLEGGVVGVLDCGMIGRIDEQLREDFEDMLLAAVDRNADDLTEYVVRLGSVPPEFNRDALRSEIGEFISDFGGQSIEEFDVSGALNGMTNIIRRYGIILPSSCSMLLKVLVMLEGTSRQLDPKFSLAELIKPYYGKVARRRYSPQKLLNRTRRTLRDWDRLIDVLPRDLADILRRVRQGSFDVNLQHRRLDSTINRLVLGIITAALFLGSTALWSRDARPLIGGVSLFGALGSVVALILGIRLLLAIKKSGSINSDK
jgi:ubiquinone biosynthesis protein